MQHDQLVTSNAQHHRANISNLGAAWPFKVAHYIAIGPAVGWRTAATKRSSRNTSQESEHGWLLLFTACKLSPA